MKDREKPMEIYDRDPSVLPSLVTWPGFGDRVRAVLDKRSRNQVWLAKKLGIDAGTLSRYLGNSKNATVPPFDVVVKIVDLLEADATWLAFGQVPRKPLWFLSDDEIAKNPVAALSAGLSFVKRITSKMEQIKFSVNGD